MDGNAAIFLQEHPRYDRMLVLYAMAWVDTYGRDISICVAENDAQQAALVAEHSARGFVLKDENAFGFGLVERYVALCFVKIK